MNLGDTHHGLIFEFISHAALENRNFVLGAEALRKNKRVPIKVILDHLAGIGKLEALPHAQRLLEWCQGDQLAPGAERAALSKHLEFLGRAAFEKAADNGLVITKTNITYPGYLCPKEGDLDFEKLKSFVLKFIRSVPPWAGAPQEHQMVSEGHGAALSICEDYEDPLRTRNHRRLWEHFRGLRGNDGLNFFHVDGGSSTFVCMYIEFLSLGRPANAEYQNFQRMTLTFDRERGVVHNKWLDDSAWSSGMSHSPLLDVAKGIILILLQVQRVEAIS